MTRKTPKDWKRSARDSITETLYDVENFIEENEEIRELLTEIDELINQLEEQDDVGMQDTDEVKGLFNQLKSALIDHARHSFSLAGDVNTLRTGSVPRGLRGKEPVGYSKPDAGVTTDAVYGSRAANNQMSQQLFWPLELDQWSKEKPNKRPDGTVEAEGTKKYTKMIGGRKVHIIIDERNYSPI